MSTTPQSRRPIRAAWKWGLMLLGVGALLLAILLLDLAVTWVRTEPAVDALAKAVPLPTAFMEMRRQQGVSEFRYRWFPLDSLPTPLVCAVVAAEDGNFFHYSAAFDPAAQYNLRHRLLRGDFSRGNSGIAQQLARNLWLSPDRTVRRKAREYLLATLLNRRLSKERQLELYLNLVEWGEGVWGVAAASESWFGRPAAELTPTEVVMLVRLLPAPRRGLTTPFSPGGQSHLTRVADAFWLQASLDELTARATRSRLGRIVELVRAGLSPREAVKAAEVEMGLEQPIGMGDRTSAWAVRCNRNRRRGV